MFSIGEFSKITGLTVKALRFYHAEGVLEPSRVDASGYRYYAASKIETARVVAELRKLEFPLATIAEILGNFEEDGEILDYLDQQKQAMRARRTHYAELVASLERIIQHEREARMADQQNFQIEEKELASMRIAAVRMQGRYSDCGKGFAAIGKRLGRYMTGKPFLLHYDAEYKEEDANFEACVPVRGGESKENVQVRELPGGRCVSLLHRGPYDELGRSYAKVFEYIQQQGYQQQSPIREHYLKGPGMIFRGNPKNYLTEIQVLID